MKSACGTLRREAGRRLLGCVPWRLEVDLEHLGLEVGLELFVVLLRDRRRPLLPRACTRPPPPPQHHPAAVARKPEGEQERRWLQHWQNCQGTRARLHVKQAGADSLHARAVKPSAALAGAADSICNANANKHAPKDRQVIRLSRSGQIHRFRRARVEQSSANRRRRRC